MPSKIPTMDQVRRRQDHEQHAPGNGLHAADEPAILPLSDRQVSAAGAGLPSGVVAAGGIGLVAFVVLIILALRPLLVPQQSSAASGITVAPTVAIVPTVPVVTVIATPTVLPATATPAATSTPVCVSAQSQLVLVEDLERKSAWKQAAATADAALDLPALCPDARQALTQRAVTNRLNLLIYEPSPLSDRAAQQQSIDAYLALRRRAVAAQVDFPSPVALAKQAYATSQFLLSITALEQAYIEHTFHPERDTDATHLYISALYNVGYFETQAGAGSATYSEGLSFLRASHQLALLYGTGQREAGDVLTQIVGPDETTWPPPYASPLLASSQ